MQFDALKEYICVKKQTITYLLYFHCLGVFFLPVSIIQGVDSLMDISYSFVLKSVWTNFEN